MTKETLQQLEKLAENLMDRITTLGYSGVLSNGNGYGPYDLLKDPARRIYDVVVEALAAIKETSAKSTLLSTPKDTADPLKQLSDYAGSLHHHIEIWEQASVFPAPVCDTLIHHSKEILRLSTACRSVPAPTQTDGMSTYETALQKSIDKQQTEQDTQDLKPLSRPFAGLQAQSPKTDAEQVPQP